MLTPREWEVAQLMAGGLSTSEIALELDISLKTAEKHARRIARKLELASPAEVPGWVKKQARNQERGRPVLQITRAGMVW